MKLLLLKLLLFFSLVGLTAQTEEVRVVTQPGGMKLTVGGQDFMINGMNWDYFPIGTNYSFVLWEQSDEIIKEALAGEMTYLQAMGVNAIRVYTGIPARWITYIHQEYGIYTMLNHSFGRYGVLVGGNWLPNTAYADLEVRKQLLKEVTDLAREYQNTPGLLMYLLGNENNYGLSWEGAETESLPEQNRQTALLAQPMYTLFNEAAVAMKAIDQAHPIAMCNGDLLYLEIIAKECPDVDIYGTNMYRGVSFGDAFERVKNEYGKPLMFTEFGADAFNAKTTTEDQLAQAYYMVGNWQDIYANAAGMGNAGNSLGGFTFQYSDGWWKFGQTTNLDVHDNNASWPNGGYDRDYVKGQNNMNEEWFGIMAKGPTNEKGLYNLTPRAAYYALQKVHKFNPYRKGATPKKLNRHFRRIRLTKALAKAQHQ